MASLSSHQALRQMLANANSGYNGRSGMEVARIRGRLRLHVPGVQVARTAIVENEDA